VANRKAQTIPRGQLSSGRAVATLRDAKMDLSGSEDDKKLQAAFASGTLLVTAKVMDVSGAQELQVRKTKTTTTQSPAQSPAFIKFRPGREQAGQGPRRFPKQEAFDFAFADPEKSSFTVAKSYFLTRSGGDWWSNGTKMDPGTVSAFIDKIRDLSASKFPERGSLRR